MWFENDYSETTFLGTYAWFLLIYHAIAQY